MKSQKNLEITTDQNSNPPELEDKKALKNWVIVNTSNFDSIQLECKRAQEQNLMIGIIGSTGAGKTTALKHYHEQGTETYLITCSRTMKTKQLLAEILRAFGIQYIASDFEMMKMIVSTVNRKNDVLIIIDEASKLTPNALMYLQDIWDGIEENSGLILAGVEYLYSNMKKGAERNKQGIPEFYGRITSWLELTEPTKKEIKAVCHYNGIENPEDVTEIIGLKNFRYVRNIILNLKNQ